MLGWLSGLLGLVTGPFRQLWDDLINIIKSVEQFLENRQNVQQNDMNAVIAGLFRLSAYIVNFINGPYTNFVHWTENRTDALAAQEARNYNALAGDINQTRSWAAGLIGAAESLARSLFGDLTKWIIGTIFGPLSHDIATALGWIANEGAMLLDLILHPEKLISILLKYLFGLWVELLVKYGPIVVSYGIKHWKMFLPVILRVLEEIINEIA